MLHLWCCDVQVEYTNAEILSNENKKLIATKVLKWHKEGKISNWRGYTVGFWKRILH